MTKQNGHELDLPQCFAPRRTLREAAVDIRDSHRLIGGTLMDAFIGSVRIDEWSRVLSVMAHTDQFA